MNKGKKINYPKNRKKRKLPALVRVHRFGDMEVMRRENRPNKLIKPYVVRRGKVELEEFRRSTQARDWAWRNAKRPKGRIHGFYTKNHDTSFISSGTDLRPLRSRTPSQIVRKEI